jgi:hypothetical protein
LRDRGAKVAHPLKPCGRRQGPNNRQGGGEQAFRLKILTVARAAIPMWIHFHGTRLYGEVDRVPGMFHVSTMFFHVYFLPLWPVGGYVIVERPEENGSFQGEVIRSCTHTMIGPPGKGRPFCGKAIPLQWKLL